MVNHLTPNCQFCGSQSKNLLKCSNCGYPLSDEICYFDLFSLNKKFRIDKAELYQAFLALQQKFHPDNFIHKKSNNQKNDEERASTLINLAFNTLKNDRKRAEYLLKKENIFVNSAIDNIKPEPTLLSDIFMRSEYINDINDIRILESELKSIQEKVLSYFDDFANNFEKNLLLIAGQNLIAIRYYEKLMIEIQQKLEQF